jgi:hypothetical protein
MVASMRKIEHELKREFPFAVIDTTDGNHLRLRLPNGKFVTVSNTPGCVNFLHNVRRDVRRLMDAPIKEVAE